VQAAARSLGIPVEIRNASNERDIVTAFSSFVQQSINATFVAGDSFFLSRRDQLIAAAARHAIPTSYQLREFVASGGLMSYGTDVMDAYRLAGVYAGRVLKGTKPADLPVQQSVKFELAINLKTANALGLTIPDKLLALADEVIE
jgi:putative ABC transport system substrate-binding protein